MAIRSSTRHFTLYLPTTTDSTGTITCVAVFSGTAQIVASGTVTAVAALSGTLAIVASGSFIAVGVFTGSSYTRDIFQGLVTAAVQLLNKATGRIGRLNPAEVTVQLVNARKSTQVLNDTDATLTVTSTKVGTTG